MSEDTVADIALMRGAIALVAEAATPHEPG
jgi:hypothetical protein